MRKGVDSDFPDWASEPIPEPKPDEIPKAAAELARPEGPRVEARSDATPPTSPLRIAPVEIAGGTQAASTGAQSHVPAAPGGLSHSTLPVSLERSARTMPPSPPTLDVDAAAFVIPKAGSTSEPSPVKPLSAPVLPPIANPAPSMSSHAAPSTSSHAAPSMSSHAAPSVSSHAAPRVSGMPPSPPTLMLDPPADQPVAPDTAPSGVPILEPSSKPGARLTVNLDTPSVLAAVQMSYEPAANPVAVSLVSAHAKVPVPPKEPDRSLTPHGPPTLMVEHQAPARLPGGGGSAPPAPSAASPERKSPTLPSWSSAIKPEPTSWRTERKLPDPPAWASNGNTNTNAPPSAYNRWSTGPDSGKDWGRDSRYDWDQGARGDTGDDSDDGLPASRSGARKGKPTASSARSRQAQRLSRRAHRPHPVLKACVVFLLLIGAGALAASYLIPKPQQVQLQSDARDLLRRAADRISSRIQQWRGGPPEGPRAGENAVAVARVADSGRKPAATPDKQAVVDPRPAGRRARGKRQTVALMSVPDGATVIGKEGLLGVTPLGYTLRSGGIERLTFTLDGYKPVTRKIGGRRKTTSVVVKLVPKSGTAKAD